MTARGRYQGWLAVTLGGVVLVAWFSLWWLEESPWGTLFHAHGSVHHGPTGPGVSTFVQALLFIAGWALMSVAMMLPATFPLIEIFGRLVRRRPERDRLVALLISGYLLAWTAFGAVAYVAARAIEPFLGAVLPPELAPAALLLLAGGFQFSSLKYRCLDECQTPLSFVTRRWGYGAPQARALRLGMAHGMFCVGCCWALMLLMFAVSTGHLLWMLALGVLMGLEKNMSWGRKMGKPLGYALLLLGVFALVRNL